MREIKTMAYQFGELSDQSKNTAIKEYRYSKTKLESLFNKYLGKGKKETAKLLADNCLEDIYMELCAKLEKQGYNEIEHKSSDEYITEEIEANEYEFTEDGNRI